MTYFVCDASASLEEEESCCRAAQGVKHEKSHSLYIMFGK